MNYLKYPTLNTASRSRRARRTLAAAFLFCVPAAFSLTAMADEARFDDPVTSRDSNNNICIEFQDVRVVLPSDWSGKCQMNISEDYVSFCHVRSRELWTEELGYANGGHLFTIAYSEDDSYTETDPSYLTIGEADGGWYYVSFPTDLQAYTEDEDCYAEFTELSADVEWVKSNIVLIDSDDITIKSDDYILPQSSTAYLTANDISSLSADELQTAINEIYARHHRKFVLEEVQEYFDSKSWYTGTIEAEDFDVSVMNAYENENISLLLERLQTLTASGSEASASSADAIGTIIETGDSSFRIRKADGSTIQFWYNVYKLPDMGIEESEIQAGAEVSLVYDTESYEATSILLW